MTVREASLGQHRTANRRIVNGLSVDVEEYFQVGAFENTIDPADWDGIASRVELNTGAVLDLFARCSVKATFFTLGWVAHRHPALIRRIIAEGHEIASHGWDHTRVFTMTPDLFAEDIDKARKALEDAGGVAIRGYRAPSFSIDQRTPWAHPILAERSYAYSSSVAPIAHDHYGWRAAPRFAFHPVEGSELIELPVTTVQLGERRFGAGGGGFFRILPYALSRWALNRVNSTDGQPAIFYFHPWEVDPDQPRVEGAPLRSRLRHYTGLDAMADKLERLTRDFSWCRIDEIALPLAAGKL
ncbi:MULTISPECIES: XrtA system polysaccharide deacetylase [Pseudomonadota]|jgi:polysaccharide deacetylase family protein (PEP-CTERM system associated)|uniref:XrtA system polysaccharide deacetylase n=1 Tax=Pseudomonadota TaxID=1224 RepID=UPI00076A6E25|nr:MULTISPECIES: XrtA system polysaccharide deacetylase [Pseudomonadota]MAF63475.1 polysaccharide deacetylase family protein [Blastomonas sp.]|tara:strand:+ start:32388 stop:33284 length:897 start_codon:yes stop_codon:yes gene_type:complete